MALNVNVRLAMRLARILLPILKKKAEESPNELDDVAIELLEVLLSPEIIKILDE